MPENTTTRIEAEVNGAPISAEVEASTLLLDFLREELLLTGAKRSCEVQVCGSCTVLVDGGPVSSCCYLAADIDGRSVVTIEGVRDEPGFEPYERAFIDHAAVQCGFCIPGMILTTKSLADEGELPRDEEGLRDALSGNVCRCTGYRAIIDAVGDIAKAVQR